MPALVHRSYALAIEGAGASKPELILVDLAPYAADLLDMVRVVLGPLLDDPSLGLAGTLLEPFELEKLHALLSLHTRSQGYLS